MLNADDAGVVSQSSEKLRKVMRVLMVVYVAFGLTVSKTKTEIMCLRAKGMPESMTIFSVDAASLFTLGRTSTTMPTLCIEVDRRIRNVR